MIRREYTRRGDIFENVEGVLVHNFYITGINKEGEKILEIKKQEDRFLRVGWKKIQKQ